jgi:hypothetical protein
MQMRVFGPCHCQPSFNVSVSVLIVTQAETAVSSVNQNMDLTGLGCNVGSVHIYSIILVTLHCLQFVMLFFSSSPKSDGPSEVCIKGHKYNRTQGLLEKFSNFN